MSQVYCQLRVSVKMRVWSDFRCLPDSPDEWTLRQNNPSRVVYREGLVRKLSKFGKIQTDYPSGKVHLTTYVVIETLCAIRRFHRIRLHR